MDGRTCLANLYYLIEASMKRNDFGYRRAFHAGERITVVSSVAKNSGRGLSYVKADKRWAPKDNKPHKVTISEHGKH